MSASPTQKAFKRLFRNKSALFGMIVIVISLIMAIMGYAITPDSTPFSNDQVLQISNTEPGFSIPMLLKHKNRDIPRVNFLEKMFSGQPNPYELVPMNDYKIVDDSIIVQEYAGKGGLSVERRISLADAVYPLNPESPVVRSGEQISLTTYTNQQVETTVAALQQEVKNNLIQSYTYPMGADRFGRDMLSRLIIGVRVSLAVGFIAVLLSVAIGVFLGSIAGYYGGKVDDAIMWLINVVWSIPTILLVFAITLALGRGLGQIFVAIGLTMWVETARVVRGQVMSVKQQQFVEAAQGMGFSDMRTIFLHILPNITGPIIVISAANFATAILIEAGLSYLGLGVESTVPTWGRMLAENYGYIISDSKSYLALTPGFAIMLMVLAFNLIGNGLRDALDIKTSLH